MFFSLPSLSSVAAIVVSGGALKGFAEGGLDFDVAMFVADIVFDLVNNPIRIIARELGVVGAGAGFAARGGRVFVLLEFG